MNENSSLALFKNETILLRLPKKVDFKIWISSFSIHENPIQFAMCVLFSWKCKMAIVQSGIAYCVCVVFLLAGVSAYGQQSIVDWGGKTPENEIHVMFCVCEAHERKSYSMQWFFSWLVHLTQTFAHTHPPIVNVDWVFIRIFHRMQYTQCTWADPWRLNIVHQVAGYLHFL